MKKLFLKSFVMLAVSAMMVSCGGSGLGKLAMDSPEAVNKVKDVVTSNVSPDEWKIVELSWMEGIGDAAELENNLNNGSITTRMVKKNGQVFSQSYIGQLNWKPSDISPDHWYKEGLIFEKVTPVDAAKLDAAVIMKQIEDAKKLIPAEYEFKSLASYCIGSSVPRAKDGEYGDKLETTFKFNVVEKGNETVSNAGSTSIVYYELNFEVAPDGTVILKE